MKKLFRLISSRLTFALFFIALELVFVFVLVNKLSECSSYVRLFMNLLNLVLIISLFNKNENPMFTLSWSILIVAFAPVGWIFYLILKKRRRNASGLVSFSEQRGEPPENDGRIPEKIFSHLLYIYNASGSMFYNNSETKYYPCGEIFYEDFISELKKAEKFIFLEYFIISKGKMWDEISELLLLKASDGVDIRIIYDDMCCLMFDKKLRNELKNNGIKAVPFNTIHPFPDVFFNCRDHRKIAVIDGKTAFTGGINIADEYINKKERFGYWKDSALMVTGSPALSMTKSFLNMWKYCTGEAERVSDIVFPDGCTENGIVHPFDDTPGDSERTAEMSYMKIINSSVRYVYITTPYLIPDSDMMTALKLAASSGVDVRIITPHIPDKKYIFAVTRSNYRTLIEGGVRIYEYLPGFIHSKTIVSDDICGIVGTANFDYRSFYMLFENGVYMYNTHALTQMKNDFEKTLDSCVEITRENYGEISLFYRFFGAILKILSPLM